MLSSEFIALPADKLGPDFCQPIVGRGASCADIDGDGDMDLLITQTGGSPLLLRNDQQMKHHFLRLKLVGRRCNRDAIGAWVEVHVADQILRRQVMPTRSYLSQTELPVTIGLGTVPAPDKVIVHWPGGGDQEVVECWVDGTTLIEQD